MEKKTFNQALLYKDNISEVENGNTVKSESSSDSEVTKSWLHSSTESPFFVINLYL